MSAEVWFYHLERRSVEEELPGLLQRGLERQLRMAVIAPEIERLRDLSQSIWSWQETAFLPHGIQGDGNLERQPICLCTDNGPANSATFRFYVDGAAPTALDGVERVIVMFDGKNEEAVQQARTQWKALKPLASTMKYWRQNDEGRWQDQASS